MRHVPLEGWWPLQNKHYGYYFVIKFLSSLMHFSSHGKGGTYVLKRCKARKLLVS